MNDLTIQLTAEDNRCLYQQIYEYIKNEIRKGKLLADEKLPSTRSLAEYLQVARSTIDFAYGQLQAEGYIEARPYKGYFVCHIEDLLDLSANRETVPVHKEETEKKTEHSENEVDFAPHGISLKEFPYATWKRITKNILVDANSELFTLGEPQGDYKLRETISRYLYSSRGVNCRPEQIVIGAGNDYLFMLLEKIIGKNITIAMEEPTYQRAYKIFDSFDYTIETIPMDEAGLNTAKLYETGASVAYVMPSHQYPTGIVMPIGRRLELLKWAQEQDERYIIEDDYDSEFRFRGKPIPALQGTDRRGKVIYMSTFSKSIAPAIRVGYMVLPPALLEKYKNNCGFYASTVSRIDQQILNEFITEGHFERYLNKMRKLYKEKHDFLLEELHPFEKNFRISGENAGLHLLLTSKKGVSELELLQTAHSHKIRLYGISEACMGKQYTDSEKLGGTVLLGFGALEKDELLQGIQKLKKAWALYL